ncbi:hypothetical protein B0H14DRAFT_3447337 [Mycena olivaceomarginata]|nr:hypothetical protein B0H14DRAFT_3447337 [Mycena olivaceomarginata]
MFASAAVLPNPSLALLARGVHASDVTQVPATRQTSVPQCAVDTVQYLFWVNTVGGALQSSRDTIPGAEALAVVGILDDINLGLVNAVANGNSVAQTGFTSNIGPVFDEANKLLTEVDNSSALTALANAQDAAKSIAADCN